MVANTHGGPAPSTAPSDPASTSVRPLLLARYLHHHPNRQYVDTLLSHITHGFDIGYQGPHLDVRAPNLSSARVHPKAIDDYLHKECSAGRMAGPFPRPPFSPFHCAGLGVVPKQDGTWRVITHLSAPDGLSINDFIDPEAVTLSYTTIDDAVRISQQLGRGTLLAKIDLKRAFRQCPVRQADWHLLGLQWRDQFYYDKCLPFGLRSSPFLFDTFATALEYIFRHQLHNPNIIHYLDDFLIAGPAETTTCSTTFTGIESLCSLLGVATKDEKRTPPTTRITFLGVEVDTITQTISLPQDKLRALMHELHTFSTMEKCTKRNLLSLIGKLAFAAKVIPAGRLFTRRLIDASTRARCLHHHLRLSRASQADIRWWLTFASNWNGKAFFLDPIWTPSPAFQLFTDASDHGFGAYWAGHWLQGTWSTKQHSQDIQWRELYTVVAAAHTWGEQWARKRLLVHCDNQAVVHIWQAGTSKNSDLMALVRTLFLKAATHNFTILLQHIQGVDNGIADSLSRSQFHRFRRLAPDADADPTPTHAFKIDC